MLTTIGSNFLCLVLGLCFSPTFSHFGPSPKFSVRHQFRQLEFEYYSKAERQADIDSRVFIPGIPAPIDADFSYNPRTKQSKTFITIPRFQDGIPVTLGTIVPDYNGNELIRPYPSWDMHRNPGACKQLRIVSVYRMMIDECQRIWIMDSGQLGDSVACPPQLLAFDLRTDRLIVKYELPKAHWNKSSTFVTPVVDVISDYNYCENTFVYMADCIGNSIVVYDNSQKTSWLVKDKSMAYDPKFEKYTIKGSTFNLTDGILGMSLTPYFRGEGRRLFYHAMSSNTEHWIRTSDLQNQKLFLNNPYSPALFHHYNGTRNTQSAAEAIDSDGVMYFGLMSDVKLACFVTRGEYGIPGKYTDIVDDNQETLQFISGAKVITDPMDIRQQSLMILSSRFQRVATNTVNPKEINFRILIANVNNLKYGTKCDPHFLPPPGPGPQIVNPTENPVPPNNNPGPVVFPTAD